MSNKGDAEISVGVDTSMHDRAVAVMKTAWRDLGESIKSSIGGAAREVVNNLANVATAQGRVNFSSQHARVREFEAATARMAVATGRDLESVRASFEATGRSIGKRPAEVAAWSQAVGQLTYNTRGAGEAMQGLAGLAAQTGRGVEEWRGLAVTLGTVGHVAGDTRNAIGSIVAQADALGTRGGVAAFADQIEALTDVISHFATSSEKDFLKVTALAGTLGKNLDPRAAMRVQQGALGALAADPLKWERFLGHSVQDEHGQIKDPTKTLQEITEKVKKRYGPNARRVLQLNFGAEVGAAMYSTDFAAASRAAGLTPSMKPSEALTKLNQTDAGRRAVAESTLDASSRELMGSATLLGKAADSLQRFASSNPITATIVSGALSAGLGQFMTKFGASLATLMGQKGGGGGLGGVVDLATKGPGASVTGGAFKGAGKWGILGALGASLGVGWSLGTALDENFGISDWLSGTGKHSRIKSENDEADKTADVELRKRIAGEKSAREVKIAALMAQGYDRGHAVLAIQQGESAPKGPMATWGAPSDGSGNQVAAGSDSGVSPSNLEHISKAVEAGAKNMKITIVNSTGGPIEVAGQSSQSSAAGNQG